MKAILFRKTGSISDLEVANIPNQKGLKQNQVRLQFIAGALNHLDLWVLKGLPRVKYEFPHLCGADLCARVFESRSAHFRVGDRVILYPAESSGQNARGQYQPENLCEDFRIRGENAPGVFCEEIVVDDRYLLLAPEHLSDHEAAALPLSYVTAWQMVVEKAQLYQNRKFFDTILVHGAGSGVTQAILELCLSFGMTQIATTSRAEEKLEPWRARGVKTFLLHDKVSDEIRNWSKASSGSDRIGIIFDHVGEALFELNTRLLKNGGRFITCGATSGHMGRIDLRHLYFRQLQLLGSTMGSLQHFRAMVSWVQTSKIRPAISDAFSFHDAQNAYQLMESATQNGKIVLYT
jgi:NADPH:quinone reductase-like Zn-dependent oxidoreductase